MTRSFRILFAAFAAMLALAGAPAQGQGAATITFNDPNCGSWGMTQSGSIFTLTCQSLTCSISALPASPLPTDNVTLTANCGASPSATYAWSQTPLTAGCPPVSGSTTNTNALTAPGATVLNCTYKVAATDGANGGGTAPKTLNWTSAPPPTPSGCSVGFTVGSASLPVTGGAITMVASCTSGTSGSTTWSWTKFGTSFGSGTTVSDTLPANVLTTPTTTTYQVTATNGGSPTTVTQVVTVAGTGGGGGSIDVRACTTIGYTGRPVEIPYPLNGNSARVYTQDLGGTFGPTDMVVVKFTAPASELTVGASILLSYQSGFDHNRRLATLSTQPCVVATSSAVTWTILASTALSQSPSFQLALVGTGTSQVKLTPGATYYVNYVNRGDYNGANSCTTSDCRAYIDFNN